MLDPKAIKKALLIAKGLPDRRTMHFSEVGKRIPELEAGANKVNAGEMSGSEYQQLINQHKPVYPYESVPNPASYEEIHRALSATDPRKVSKIGKLADYPEGHPVALRLDIPAYEKQGVWVPTIHEGNKTIAHEGAAHISDATFNANENKGIKIAAGGQKNPYAVINGKLKKTSTADIHKLAQQYLNHPDWRQVGMDPTRHGYFYDRHTQEPIEHAEEVLQVGPLVLAKNPTYGDKSKYKYADGGIIGKPSRMQRAEMRMQQGLSPIEKGETNINVYHGTAHTFPPVEGAPLGKFDSSKIGTGEGAQAYGHGIYVAQNPNVAKDYQLSTSKHQFLTNDGNFEPRELEHLNVRAKALSGDLDTAIEKARELSKPNLDYPETAAKAARDLQKLEKLKASGGIRKNPGLLYTADLPDEHIDRMLDWDKPFNKQHPYVQNALKSSGIYKQYKDNLSNFASPMSSRNKDMKGGNIHAFMEHLSGGDSAKASETLRKMGIPGIKYLDERSKFLGKGTQNFVVFPGEEHNLNILARKAEGGDVEAPQQPEDTTPSRQLNEYGLYSHAAEAADALKQDKGSPQQMIAALKGVKPDELYWSGVHNAFKDQKTITKQQLADHFRNALPKMSVKTLTPTEGTMNDPKAKYAGWTAEGKIRSSKQPNLSTNYREVLQTLPLNDMNPAIGNTDDAEKDFTSSHWREPNIVSHVRLSDRETQPPQQKAPKAPPSDSSVMIKMNGVEANRYSEAWKTPHKNIFVTPSIQKRNKYVLTHGPSGGSISSNPVDFYHAMSNATKLAEKYPHVFDLDREGLVNFIANPQNKETVNGVREIVNSDPPELPASKKAKPFTKEKILHVDESQSDFGQALRKHTDKFNEAKEKIQKLKDEHNFHKGELERLVKENPHLVDETGRPMTVWDFRERFPNLDQMTDEQKEQFNRDNKNWNLLHSHERDADNKRRAITSYTNDLSAEQKMLLDLPKSPYVDNTSKWTDLNVKRILTEAAKGNYDKVIWTPGSVQSKIYGIGRSYSKILYDPASKRLVATPKGRSRGVTEIVDPKDLPNYLGEGLTKKLLESNESGVHMLRGRNLDVPNPGQEAYYGKIFPRRLLELAREHDPEAALTEHRDSDKLVDKYPAIQITPRMRESILKNGFKAYKTGGYIDDSGILSAAQDPSKAIRKALMIAKKRKG
ncbi:MAG: hypothetical protein RL560_6 [Actinomycetota bacterium]|jgi:hypothetical protein